MKSYHRRKKDELYEEPDVGDTIVNPIQIKKLHGTRIEPTSSSIHCLFKFVILLYKLKVREDYARNLGPPSPTVKTFKSDRKRI